MLLGASISISAMSRNNPFVLIILPLVLLHSHVTSTCAHSINFSASDLSSLSKVRYETRSSGLEVRCEAYEQKLRELLPDQPTSLSPNTIFSQSIDAETLRRLPFDNRSPILLDLKECVEKVPKYKAADEPAVEQQPEAKNKQCESANQDFLVLQKRLEDQSNELNSLNQDISSKNKQIGELKERLERCTRQSDPFDGSQITDVFERARFEEMKKLYYQASERESKANKRLEEARGRVAQLEAQTGSKMT